MKDLLGILLIVFAAMISESLSSTKTTKEVKTKTEERIKTKEFATSNISQPKNLADAYQNLVDSTQKKKEKEAK
jgi:hypothetical protein